jgi:NAD(P)-dependent dehydrogenase (short-subunit alcohol dehydrogenase family)
VEALAGKVAVITGAASGIGLGVAQALAAEGMRVALADVDVPRLDDEVAALRATGVDVIGVETDVADPGSVDALAARVTNRYGGTNLLCNNAGIIRTGRSWEISLDDWDRVLRVNLWGVLHGIRSFVPAMLASGEPGHVVNMGSMASVAPVPGIAPYNTSKHGVLALSETLERELEALGAPIGVTTVFPGRVQTRLGGGGDAQVQPPDPSLMEPIEVGRLVVRAVRTRQAFCFTHPERIDDAATRFGRILGSPTATAG